MLTERSMVSSFGLILCALALEGLCVRAYDHTSPTRH